MKSPLMMTLALVLAGLLLLAGCTGNAQAGLNASANGLGANASAQGSDQAGNSNGAGAQGNASAGGQLPPQMANPASVFCIQAGGNLTIQKDSAGGEIGVCHFANGTSCEEWAYMRGGCMMANGSGWANGGMMGNGSANASGSGMMNASAQMMVSMNATALKPPFAWDSAFFANISAPPSRNEATAQLDANGVQVVSLEANNYVFTPNVIYVKRGVPVRIVATSKDVEHSLGVPLLQINADMPVGKTVSVEFTPQETGIFPFRCAVFCGSGHRTMTGMIVVTE